MKAPEFTASITLGVLAAFAASSAAGDAASPPPGVYRDQIHPHWIENPDHTTGKFWYRLDLPGNHREFILVDAEKGLRAPAFDHDRVAASLARLIGHPVDAKALPVNSLTLDPDGKHLTLHGANSDWRVDPDTSAVTPAGRSDAGENQLAPERIAHPSRASAEESEIEFINRLDHAVDLYWLDTDGVRRFYGSIPPGGDRTQPTYAGHAWLVAAKDGGQIAIYDANDTPGVALIGGTNGQVQSPPDSNDADSAPPADDARSPDHKWEVFVRDDNLFLRDTATGAEQPLTSGATAADSYARNAEASRSIEMDYQASDPREPAPEVYWAPDSRHFVAMRHRAGTRRLVYLVQSSPEDQLQPKLVSYPYLKPGDDVPYATPHLFDAGTKREIPVDGALFANPWSIDDVRWRPDSGEFTFLYNQRGHQALRILGVDAITGAVRPIIDERSRTFICYSSKYLVHYLDDTGEIIWMSERDGWNHLYLYDAKTGAVKYQITKGAWVVRGVDRVDEKKRQIWFHAGGIIPGQDPYYLQYCRIDFDGTGLTLLTHEDGNHSVQYSPDYRFFIDTWSRVNVPPVTELRLASDGRLLLPLERADASGLLATGWQAPEPFAAKGRDGVTDIYGVIIRPRHFDPAKSYPVLEDIYAGPQDSFVPKSYSSNYRFQDLADRGFIIVKIDGMGTSNRSKAFHDVCWKNLADAGFPDRIPWIKAAAAKYPCMDLSRVGIFGVSAGGQDALRAMLDHGDFYKAAVADSGCHDNRMDKIWWNEQWMGWPVDESYARSSNVVDAHKLHGKLLLMVGEMDKNVDPASTMQVVDALIKANKDFELLVMPNTGHGVTGTPYGMRRLIDFFTRTLTPSADEHHG